MIAQPRRPVKVKLQMLDQGVELILEGVKAEGLDAAMALQDFAGAHNLARFAIDQGEGLEILWQPDPPTMRFGDILVQVPRSEEHTSELQSLMRISYAVFCLKKKKQKNTTQYTKH